MKNRTAYVIRVNPQGRAVFFSWRDAEGTVKDGAFYRHSDGVWGSFTGISRRKFCLPPAYLPVCAALARAETGIGLRTMLMAETPWAFLRPRNPML